MAILSCLSQHEKEGEWVPLDEVQKALALEKQNTSKLAALRTLNKDLLSMPKEQHHWLGAQV